MQNYIAPRQTFFNHVWHQLKNTPIFKKYVPLQEQLSADEIIYRLTIAINVREVFTIQINKSANSEQVNNYTGYIYQNHNGQILVQSSTSHEITIISPESIRYINTKEPY